MASVKGTKAPGVRWDFIVAAVLGITVILSSLAVVYAKYQSRILFAELQTLKQARDKMEIEWGQLQLEQSTWTAHGRIENIARERLGMVLPSPEQIVVIGHE